MYSRGVLPKGFAPSTLGSTDLKLLKLTTWNESGLNEFTKNYVGEKMMIFLNSLLKL